MAHRLARKVCARAALFTLMGSLLAAPAAADHFLTHGDALKPKPVAQPVPSAKPAAQQARAAGQDDSLRSLSYLAVREFKVDLAPQAAGDDILRRSYSTEAAQKVYTAGQDDSLHLLSYLAVREFKVDLAPQAAGGDISLRSYSTEAARARADRRAVPGLLGIAAQAYRAKAVDLAGDAAGATPQAYTLADAMRDAIWRKQTARRLRDLFDD
jgi:hypothetical protein